MEHLMIDPDATAALLLVAAVLAVIACTPTGTLARQWRALTRGAAE